MKESSQTILKIKKYFSYAFGEIIIVVVGILIAFQLDNYAEKRKEKALSKEYLFELQNEFSDDKSTLAESIIHYETVIENSEQLILELQKNSYKISDSVGILRTILGAGEEITFRPESTTYDDLFSTGNLELIVNKELRHNLGDYYDFVEDNKAKEQQLQERVYFQYSLWIEKYVDIRLKFYYKSDSLPYFMNLYRSNIRSLLRDKELHERLVSAQFANLLQLHFLRKTNNMLEFVADEAEKELERLDN